MKRYIIISVLLVFVFGLNAQRTNSGSRSTSKTTTTAKSTDKEKKSNPSKSETRNRETTPARSSSAAETKRATPERTSPAERKSEPNQNESRNRETPKVETIPDRQQKEATRSENRSANPNSTPATTSGNQEPERKGRVSKSNTRETGNSRSEATRPEYQTGNTREVGTSRSREYTPRTEPVYTERRQAYRTPERPRTARTVNHSTTYVHQTVEYRRNYYPYTEPRRVEIIWDVHMYNQYRYIYPQYDYWYYPYGYRIHTVSAYDADRYIGEIARIYGRVSDVWYERLTDEYTLYFGEPYPYQDFSVIISGRQARRYSRHPERYFIDRNVAVTGLISLWEERPEMVIRKRSQIDLYF